MLIYFVYLERLYYRISLMFIVQLVTKQSRDDKPLEYMSQKYPCAHKVLVMLWVLSRVAVSPEVVIATGPCSTFRSITLSIKKGPSFPWLSILC